jgi:hypothetical protein
MRVHVELSRRVIIVMKDAPSQLSGLKASSTNRDVLSKSLARLYLSHPFKNVARLGFWTLNHSNGEPGSSVTGAQTNQLRGTLEEQHRLTVEAY